jgi:thiamine pyrophosphate-dependent acetolactate synthase large subunit-like protein
MAPEPAPPLDRRTAIPALVGRHKDFLMVSGLGGSSRDMVHLTEDAPELFAMGGAMGGASMVGLGLALAQSRRRVLVVTGEGELLMNLGAMATIALVAPTNLAILCVDNARYAETGYQESHTARVVDLEQVARGCGIGTSRTVRSEDDLAAGAELLRIGRGPVFVLLRVAPTEPAGTRGIMDAAARRLRFRHAVLGSTSA